jgi:hypothetical protein
MITQNTIAKYDFTRHEYYITINAVTNLTEYSEDEFKRIFKSPEKSLISMSKAVYRLIWNAYIGLDKNIHIEFMRKRIYLNQHGERDAIINAILEMVKGAIESGMDLNIYTEKGGSIYPLTVMEYLNEANLIDSTRKIDYNLDYDYTAEDAEIETEAEI